MAWRSIVQHQLWKFNANNMEMAEDTSHENTWINSYQTYRKRRSLRKRIYRFRISWSLNRRKVKRREIPNKLTKKNLREQIIIDIDN